jgi:hypothetical protein
MSFSGTIASDYMKLTKLPTWKKPQYIDFAASDFLSLRDSLIRYIKSVYPLEYDYFVESDLGMMFLELTAYMGAVMSMKADMLANENFFATARQRSSVKKLLELIGVRMRGPLSAAADAKASFLISPTGDTPSFVVSPQNRIATISSPEDGAAVTYTLYKTVNGYLQDANATGDLTLYWSESDNPGAATAPSSVYSNLVLQEGALVTDSGDFAATEGVKTIALTQAPVIEGSVDVFITAPESAASGAYTEVDNVYFASGSGDKIFEIIYDDEYAASVVFGDGVVGVSPNDSAGYFVTYRVGGGSRGNILPNVMDITIKATTDSVPTTAQIQNISVGAGGANAETIAHAKRWAPLTFARQDRIVTLEDYTVFANNYISDVGTVGKAHAVTRNAYSSGNIIDIYILEKASDLQLQKATPSFKRNLLTSTNAKKMATDEIVIVDGLIRTLDLVVTVTIDKEQKSNQANIISEVRGKILDYMSADSREFGQTLVLSDLNRVIFEVESVRISSIDNIRSNIHVDFNEIIQLNNLTIKFEYLD